MPDVQEVFRMATQKVKPDPGALERQFRGQRRRTTRRKLGAFAVSAAVIAAGVVFAVRASREEADGKGSVGDPAPVTDGVMDAAIVGIDGTVRSDLGLPPDAWMAELSPDGSEVYFLTHSLRVGNCGGCSGAAVERLAMMPIGGSDFDGAYVYIEGARGVQRDGSHRVIEHPTLSPDGTRLAFVGVRVDGTRDIYVAPLERSTGPNPVIGARAERLTTDPADDTFPAWAADGSTIYYENAGSEPLDDSGFSSTQEIWSVPAEGGTPTQLTDNAVPDSQPDVGPDGSIAFWRSGDIWTMGPAGDEQRTLDGVRLGLGFNPRWSPDGTKLAMLVYKGRAHLRTSLGGLLDLPLLDVVVADLETGGIHYVGAQVASDVNPPSWTPDGALLINRFMPSG
jgi:Tol biopolymer transport system component